MSDLGQKQSFSRAPKLKSPLSGAANLGCKPLV